MTPTEAAETAFDANCLTKARNKRECISFAKKGKAGQEAA